MNAHHHPDVFWMWQLVAASALNLFLQALTIGAYASRLAGVQMMRIATSISLFNLFVAVSRLANMFYAPMLGAISDNANALQRFHAAEALHTYEMQLRVILIAGSIGTICGALLMPMFLHLFRHGISAFERYGSVPQALLRLMRPNVLLGVGKAIRAPNPRHWRTFEIAGVPAKLLLANIVVTAIYSVGVVAAAYASLLEPRAARTAILASGLVNGIATVAFAVIVDPTSAFITDQAARGERSIRKSSR